MTAYRITTGDNYATDSGHFQHWRDKADRRFWWSLVAESVFNFPMCRCVMDDFGDLVRVSEVV